jgi:hypothetical protein
VTCASLLALAWVLDVTEFLWSVVLLTLSAHLREEPSYLFSIYLELGCAVALEQPIKSRRLL